MIYKYFLTALLVVSCTSSYAQTTQQSKKISDTRLSWVNAQKNDIHEINFTAGYSFGSTDGFWGQIPKATLNIYTLRYNRKLFTVNKKHLVEYVAEANLSANYTLSNIDQYQSSGSYNGFGVTPLGFQLNFNKERIIQPFLKSSTGFLYFKEPFPDERGVSFNFTLEFGAGLELMISRNASFTLGYKYHHMSNGQRGQINPGVDSNIFYSGFTIF